MKHISKHDVVGGIAVPDGDVAHVYRRFNLRPKVVMGSTTITGNNGLYKAAIFKKVRFNPRFRDGEDVDFNKRATKHGIKQFCIPGLSVEHHENKSFLKSMHWLFQSGIGATRQLFMFKEIRMPDIAFAGTLGIALGSVLVAILKWQPLWLLLPIVPLVAASFLHLHGKFHLSLRKPHHILGALSVNSVFIACYYVGRVIGGFVYLKNRNLQYDSTTA